MRTLRGIDIVVYVAYVALTVEALLSGPRGVLWYAGLCLSMACAALWFVARRQLGEAFSVRPEARRLVTRGLYARFRHPIYIFGTLAFLGAVLALKGRQAWVVWVIVIVVQIVRARREDRVLAQAFGAEYAAYRDSTWL